MPAAVARQATAGWRAPAARVALVLGPDLILLAVGVLFLSGLIAIFGGRPNFLQSSVVLPVGVLVVLVAVRAMVGLARVLRRGRQAAAGLGGDLLRMARDWMPFSALVMVYENLHEYTSLIRKTVIDEQLMRLDLRLFGIGGRGPTEWMQDLVHPWFTEYMAFAYALYFGFALILGTMLYARGRREDFRELTASIVLVFYLGFLGYVIFPAVGPRIYVPRNHPALYTVDLHGALGFYDWSAAMWDRLQRVSCDAFPSLHTACSTTALLYAFRFGDVLRPRWLLGTIFAPLVVSLWFSTIYLRQHWVVDVLAGWALSVLCFYLAREVRRYWARLAVRGPVHESRLVRFTPAMQLSMQMQVTTTQPEEGGQET